MDSDLALAQRIATVAFNLAVALLVGASAATVWLRSGTSAWATRQTPLLRRVMLAATLAGALAYVAILWLEAAAMAEVPVAEALAAVQSVLTATHYGLAWTIGAIALVITGLSVAADRVRQPKAALTLLRIVSLGVLLYSRSMVSHAGAGGDFGWAVAIDWIHLILISTWLGEVIVAALVTLRAHPGEDSQSQADSVRYIEALSNSATVALVGIFVTGLVSAWRVLGSVENVFGNSYGTTLLIKIGLVLCAAGLGGLNRFVVMPGLLKRLRNAKTPRTPADHRFAIVLQVEAVILLAVLIAAAFLSSTSPPMAS